MLRESYRLVQRNSNVSCSYLIELMFLELDVWVYYSFDLCITTGFKFNLLRASLLTVLRVVYATVWLSSMMIQKADWPNTTPISQDKKTLTFKALP